jgi:hypothetical protein
MSEPQIVLREAQPYVGIRARVTNGIRDFADNTFRELFGWVFENQIAPAGPPFSAITRSTAWASRWTSRRGFPLSARRRVPTAALGRAPCQPGAT